MTMIKRTGPEVQWHEARYTHDILGSEQIVGFCIHPATVASNSLVVVLEGLGGSKHSLANAVGNLPELPLVGVQLCFPNLTARGIETTLDLGPKAVADAAKDLCEIDENVLPAIAGSSLGCGKVLKIVNDAPRQWGDVVLDKLLIANGLSSRDIAIRIAQNRRSLRQSSDPEARIMQPVEESKAELNRNKEDTMAKLRYAVQQPGLAMLRDLVDGAINRGRHIVVSSAEDDTVARPEELEIILRCLKRQERIIYHKGSGGHYGYDTLGGTRQLGEAVTQLPQFAHLAEQLAA